MLDELEWPSLEDRRVKSFLTLFYKIHSGTVSLDKDRYLTTAQVKSSSQVKFILRRFSI